MDPKYTSQTCAECGHCEKGNRHTQASFLCKVCGHKDHADRNAARNIRARALCQQA
ncbi:MAG: transposase [Candidatus Latescibacteria bacterium]|nr:transposase [Candidatus Latescibacterota bacterium]